MERISELLLITCIVVYVVDLSGFTQTWLGWLSRWTARYNLPPVKGLRPFSCSQCMVWWCCLAWCLYRQDLTLINVALSALMAFLAITFNDFFIFIREAVLRVLRWMEDKICD